MRFVRTTSTSLVQQVCSSIIRTAGSTALLSVLWILSHVVTNDQQSRKFVGSADLWCLSIIRTAVLTLLIHNPWPERHPFYSRCPAYIALFKRPCIFSVQKATKRLFCPEERDQTLWFWEAALSSRKTWPQRAKTYKGGRSLSHALFQLFISTREGWPFISLTSTKQTHVPYLPERDDR